MTERQWCWSKKLCKKRAEFRVFSRIDIFGVDIGMNRESFLCDEHMREQLKKEHEQGSILYIEKISD